MITTEHINWLKNQCNLYVLGQCQNSICLKRGGWKKGEDLVCATCIPHEIFLEIKDKEGI